MIHSAKDLSPDRKLGIEDLLGRAISPDWLMAIRQNAHERGVDTLTPEDIKAEIDAEIEAAAPIERQLRPHR